MSSYVDLPLSAAYNASKSGLMSATNVLRMELAPLGVHVMGECCLEASCLPLPGVDNQVPELLQVLELLNVQECSSCKAKRKHLVFAPDLPLFSLNCT